MSGALAEEDAPAPSKSTTDGDTAILGRFFSVCQKYFDAGIARDYQYAKGDETKIAMVAGGEFSKFILQQQAEIARLTLDRNDKSKRMWELGHECDRLQAERDAAQARAEAAETQVRIAAGMLSTVPPYDTQHPEVALKAIQDAARDLAGGRK